MEYSCLILKLIVILVLLLVFYKLMQNRDKLDGNTEGFQYNTRQNIDYLNLKETYIEPENDPDASLKLLYANYSGVEIGQNVWENKTLDQCIDTCNQLDGCVGFSRDLVNDDSPARCYPRTEISNCHSNRKGDMQQMQNAIKYNSYIKKTVPNVLNKCIGDPDLTLNRTVYIKSRMFPNKYIGSNGDGAAVLIEEDDPEFMHKCNFRIEIGKDGIGTVSFYHIQSGKYLYRSPQIETFQNGSNPSNPTITGTGANAGSSNGVDMLILKVVGMDGGGVNRTVDKQRISFNILDGMRNMMKFKCLSLDGETIDKYIAVSMNNTKYLVCNDSRNIKDENEITFNIVDKLITTNIIKSQNQNNTTTPSMPAPSIPNNPTTTMPQREQFAGVVLDTAKNNPLYNNLITTPTNINIANYVEDNYLANQSSNVLTKISNKIDNTMLSKQLNGTIARNQEEYEMLNNLNKEIERELQLLNMDVNGKNDKLTNTMDRMRISDMSNDYFALRSAYKLPL